MFPNDGGAAGDVNVLALALIALGAAVMLVSILKYNDTVRLANRLLPDGEANVRRYTNIHRGLMCFFLFGYLIVLICLVAELNFIGNLFVSVIFLSGAIYVLLGVALQAKMLLSIQRYCRDVVERNDRLLQVENVTIFALALQAEVRDKETGKHLERCCQYVEVLAEELSLLPKYKEYLTPDYIADIVRAAALHDIGKVGIPDAILQKPGKLTAEEFECIKTHCELGANVLQMAESKLEFESFLSIARKIVLSHHEKWDGSGYPYGLRGEDIPLSGRIMALADVYDALSSRRCYKEKYVHQKTVEIILGERGRHFAPDVVDAFLKREADFRRISKNFSENFTENS